MQFGGYIRAGLLNSAPLGNSIINYLLIVPKMIQKKTLLFILFVLNILIVSAQENKPTKEQTIQYLIDFFKSHNPENDKSVNREDFYLRNEGCLLTIGFFSYWVFEDGQKEEKKRTEYVFDMSKIEQIGITYGKPEGRRSDNYQVVFLDLRPVNNQEIITKIVAGTRSLTNFTRIYLGMMPKDTNFSELKIRKAFNRLRKLCGAPDPIEF